MFFGLIGLMSAYIPFKSEIVFLGTGSSSGMPLPRHLMSSEETDKNRVSILGGEGDPRKNKNHRCNPSLLLKVRREGAGDEKTVLFDCGKTFRESIVRWAREKKIRSIDSVCLTHGHADACFGLDDLRSCQEHGGPSIPIYASEECQQVVKRVFTYLFPEPETEEVKAKRIKREESEGVPEKRHVASLELNTLTHYQPFWPLGANYLEVTPLPVMHGEDLECTAFMMGGPEVFVYLSDISRMLPKTLDVILKRKDQIDLLVVDALLVEDPHPFHFSMRQAIDLARKLRPKKTLLVGMSAQFEHDEANRDLAQLKVEEGIDIQLAYDGLQVDINL
jgi:phosphoribosyl 1,2-cyclic phosphodiesterase